MGVRLKIQGQPLDILERLMEQPGQIVSRQGLQQLLWGGEVHVDFERGLNTAMKRLRAVLGDDPAEPRYIETVARTGYVFIGEVVEIVRPEAPCEPPLAIEEAPHSRRWFLAAGGAALAATAGAGGYVWNHRSQELQLRKLSFDLGNISNVFFTADGQSVIYSAHWSGGTRWQTFIHRLEDRRPRPRPFDGLGVAAVSSRDELLLFDFTVKADSRGAIVRASLDGATPKLLDEHLLSVDWDHDGKHFACVRIDGNDDRVEFPAGRTMHISSGRLGAVRVAPTDGAVAVLEHDVRGDTGGYVLLLESGRAPKKLMQRWPHMISIGWHPNGQEVWFTGSRDGTTTALWAVDRRSNGRMVGLPGLADAMFDVHRNGRVTFIKNHARMESDFIATGRTRIAKWTQWDSRPEVFEPKVPANLIGFAPDGRFVVRAPSSESGPSTKLHAMRADGTFDREPLFEIGPPDSKGILRLNLALLSPDGRAAAYVAGRAQSELYLAEGLH